MQITFEPKPALRELPRFASSIDGLGETVRTKFRSYKGKNEEGA
jgi:hypothetical protein